MKKRFDKFFPWLFVVGDVLVLCLSIIMVSFLMVQTGTYNGPELSIFIIFIMVWVVITVLRKDYNWERTSQVDKLFSKLTVSLLWFLVIAAILWLPIIEGGNSFLFFLVLSLNLFVFISFYRVSTFIALRKYRAKGGNFRNAVIFGNGNQGSKLREVLQRRRDFGINLVGQYDLYVPSNQYEDALQGFFVEAAEKKVDIIYIQEPADARFIKKLIDFANENYIKVKVIPDNSLQLENQLSFSRYGDLLVINVNEIPLDNMFNRVLKRAFDLAFSLFVTVFVLSWLIPLVGLLIKLESKGPVFFVQERNGKNNSVFHCLKFRSMMPNDYADTHQATKNDPRVTRIGAFLRKTSLDEMPQFLNVLMGDMSIVGPRPHPVPMNNNFKALVEKYNARHWIKPGITGLAQIKGYRGEIIHTHQIRSRVRLDYFYVQNWSIWMDFSICLKTAGEIFVSRKNAY